MENPVLWWTAQCKGVTPGLYNVRKGKRGGSFLAQCHKLSPTNILRFAQIGASELWILWPIIYFKTTDYWFKFVSFLAGVGVVQRIHHQRHPHLLWSDPRADIKGNPGAHGFPHWLLGSTSEVQPGPKSQVRPRARGMSLIIIYVRNCKCSIWVWLLDYNLACQMEGFLKRMDLCLHIHLVSGQ